MTGFKHGYRSDGEWDPTYISWKGMRARCFQPTQPGYKDHGGRGIGICDRWESFINFLADMGPRPKGTTIGRIDNDGDYTPENCEWQTPKQQANNRRAPRVLLREVCRRGHPLIEENLLVVKKLDRKSGILRLCRICTYLRKGY